MLRQAGASTDLQRGPPATRRRGHEVRIEGLGRLDVERLVGREALSEGARFTIDVKAPEGLSPDELLLSDATLTLRCNDTAREVHTLVTRAKVKDGGLRLTLRSRLWLLSQNHRSRIWQRRSVREIVDQLLGQVGIETRWQLAHPLAAHEYITQYEESDHNLMMRLLADAGLFFFLDHGPDGFATAVLSDNASAYLRPALSLSYVRGAADAAMPSRAVFDFDGSARVRTTRVEVRHFDHKRPDKPRAAKATVTPLADLGNVLERYRHRNGYRETADPERRAAVDLDQQRKDARSFSCLSPCAELAPGVTVHVSGGAVGGESDFVVVALEHRGGRALSEHEGSYVARAVLVGEGVAFLAVAPAGPRIAGPLSAVVVAPGKGEIHGGDDFAIKVRFPWDREASDDGESSCFLRCMQAWAGAGFGAQFLPRAGMEVVVGFEEGDPNRPLVLGALYNGTHPAPFGPEELTRSGIRTQSTPRSEGFNELSFDDRAGEEQLRMRAQRDLDLVVLHDATTNISNARTTEVGGHSNERVAGDRSEEVLGSHTSRIAGDASQTIAGKLAQRVGAGRHLVMNGDDISRVSGLASHEARGAYALRAGTRLALSAGTEKKPGVLELAAQGSSILSATKEVLIRADETLRLRCGDSEILLTPRGITLTTPRLDVITREAIDARTERSRLCLTRSADLSAETIRLTSGAASLELDADAHLDGRLVKLACESSQDGWLEESPKSVQRPLELVLRASDGSAHAHRPFVVRAAGARVFGETDGDGRLLAMLPVVATGAEVTLWLGPRGQSETRTYDVVLEPLDAATTTKGQQQRLRHLGLYFRTPSGEFDAATRRALLALQERVGLPRSGEACDATIAQLVEAHGG